jgi:hypothetical protein
MLFLKEIILTLFFPVFISSAESLIHVAKIMIVSFSFQSSLLLTALKNASKQFIIFSLV